MSGWLRRKRLDVPEVHDLLGACERMLDQWAETELGSSERRHLWQSVHRAADALEERTYGGATITTQVSYWLRPYDPRLDDRVWRWNRPGPCRVLDLTEPPAVTARRTAQRAQEGHGDPGRDFGAHRGVQGALRRGQVPHTTWEVQGEA